jgi:broad specificity phosphatase PhoE
MSPATQSRLFLIRHGEVDSNRRMRYLGRSDEPLNRVGRRQAEDLAGAFATIAIDAVRSSPLQRALATARSIAEATGAELEIDDRLVEIDFGAWEGRSRDEVLAGSAHDRELVRLWETDPSTAAPAGESFTELQVRVRRCLDDLAAHSSAASVAVVTHMGPIKVALCTALGLPLGRSRRIFLDPATVTVIDWGPEPIVRLVNGHGHLGFDAARWLVRD